MKIVLRLFFLMTCLLMLSMVSLAQEESEDLNELLAEYIEDGEPGVSVYISYDGDAWASAYGLADLENETDISTDDVFRIASVSKPLVATVVLLLVQDGDIDLDAPLADYLSSDITDNIENADTATIRQMLQMTSGIYNYTESDDFADAVYDSPSYMWSAEEVLEFTHNEDAYFAVGEGYYYSNSNYILAELVIEAVTGNSLADELENRIFVPADMESCYLETSDLFAENIVRGYELYDDYEDITEVNDGTGLGDGGVVCSAEDLAKFLPALANGTFLNEEFLAEMLDTVDDGEDTNYGLGIGNDDTEYGVIISHDGASSGFQSVMMYLPDEDLTIVILTNNFDSEIIEDLSYDILDYFFEE